MPRPVAQAERPPRPAPAQGTLRRLGGHPALDFINTVDPDWADPEYLRDYARLIGWCEAGGLLPASEARGLRRLAGAAPQDAQAALFEALALRETLRRLCAARVDGRRAAAHDLAAFNARLRSLAAPIALAAHGLGYRRAGLPGAHELAEPGRRVLAAAADLLASTDFDHVRRCAAPGCGWFFLDRSPTGRRRWCAMESCGNRAKARRFYRRQRASPG